MSIIKLGDYTGYSETGIEEAVADALEQAGEHTRIEIVETRGSQAKGKHRHYQVTVATFDE